MAARRAARCCLCLAALLAACSQSPAAADDPHPAAPAPVSLDAVLSFSRPAECEMGGTLRRIFDSMVRRDPATDESSPAGPIAMPGLSAPLVPSVERTRESGPGFDFRHVSATLPLTGLWHGLHVTGLDHAISEESDVAAWSIRFAEPPETVRRTLNGQGFQLPPPGRWRIVDPGDEVSLGIGVHAAGAGAALTCWTG